MKTNCPACNKPATAATTGDFLTANQAINFKCENPACRHGFSAALVFVNGPRPGVNTFENQQTVGDEFVY